MLKLTLGMIIFIICSYIGFQYGNTFTQRCIQLKEALKGITILQNYILYGTTPLPEALELVSAKLAHPFDITLRSISKDLIDCSVESVFDSASNEYKKIKDEFYLNEDDQKVLSDFFKSLGESGIYGQEKIFSLTIEGIKVNLKDAEDIAKKNVKLYRYLGACIGGMIGIFIL